MSDFVESSSASSDERLLCAINAGNLDDLKAAIANGANVNGTAEVSVQYHRVILNVVILF